MTVDLSTTVADLRLPSPILTAAGTAGHGAELAAYFDRLAAGSGAGSDTRAVGFADMAAFTALTRRSSESELRGVLERFETLATDVVGAVVERAVRRGEVRADAVTAVRLEVGPALVRQRAVLGGGALDGAYLEQVVDEVLLPLFRASTPPQAAGRGSASTG